jgi:hypothetical protein
MRCLLRQSDWSKNKLLRPILQTMSIAATPVPLSEAQGTPV